MIKIIAGGKPSKHWILDGFTEYDKRLKPPFNLDITYLDEEKLAKYLSVWPFKPSDYIIVLDERGQNITSTELASKLDQAFISSRRPILLIGGAYGFTKEIRERADFVWSFSNLVFPHELMRVMLAEQLYRAQEIKNGGKYHHE